MKEGEKRALRSLAFIAMMVAVFLCTNAVVGAVAILALLSMHRKGYLRSLRREGRNREADEYEKAARKWRLMQPKYIIAFSLAAPLAAFLLVCFFSPYCLFW